MKQVTVDINKLPFEACNCGCYLWKERVVIKRISRLLTGDFEDKSQNLAFMACENCGRPHPQTKLDFKVEKINVFSSDKAEQTSAPLAVGQLKESQDEQESSSEVKVVQMPSSHSASAPDNQ